MAPNPCVEVTPVHSFQIITSGPSIPSSVDVICPGCLCGFPCAPGFVTHCGSSQWHQVHASQDRVPSLAAGWCLSMGTLCWGWVPRELTQLGQNHLWDLENELATCQEELHLSGVWAQNSTQRSGSCEFPPLSCYLRNLKGVGQGREETCQHCWFPKPCTWTDPASQPQCPFPQLHTLLMGNSFKAQPVLYTCRRVRPSWQGHGCGQGQHLSCWWVLGWGLLQHPASSHIPMSTDAGKKVVAGSTTLLNHFEIVCVLHFWKPKPICECTGGKIPLEIQNTAQGTLTGKVPFAMGYRQPCLPKPRRHCIPSQPTSWKTSGKSIEHTFTCSNVFFHAWNANTFPNRESETTKLEMSSLEYVAWVCAVLYSIRASGCLDSLASF